jgi:hypothetical protein
MKLLGLKILSLTRDEPMHLGSILVALGIIKIVTSLYAFERDAPRR